MIEKLFGKTAGSSKRPFEPMPPTGSYSPLSPPYTRFASQPVVIGKNRQKAVQSSLAIVS
jgi:hypothetical protein